MGRNVSTIYQALSSANNKQLMARYSMHGDQAYYCQGRLLLWLWELGVLEHWGTQLRIKVKRPRIKH